MSLDQSEFELSEVIQSLRAQLLQAATDGEGQNLRFRVESIDLEFKVGVRRGIEASGKTKLEFKVFGIGAGVEVGGGGKSEKEQVQTVRLKLAPENKDGGTVLTASPSSKPGG